MRDEMRKRDNYFEEIERAAGQALAAVGYGGPGAVSERHLTDLAAYFGFTIARVQDLPPSTRSISDLRQPGHLRAPAQRSPAACARPAR